MNPKKRDRVSQMLYHTCKQNCNAKRKSRKDQTPMKQSNTGHEKGENQKNGNYPLDKFVRRHSNQPSR